LAASSGAIGEAQQHLGARIPIPCSHASAEGHAQLARFSVEALLGDCDSSAVDGDGGLLLENSGCYDEKLIASVAADRVAGPSALLQHGRCARSALVAELVAERVVAGPEVVKVVAW
jgi:hypothetical protein